MRQLVFILGLCGIIFVSTAPAHAANPTTILVFGDSIIAGYGLKAKDAVPAQLENMLISDGAIVKVINGGVSGDTTSAGRSRLKWTLDQYQPDIIVLALGGNDVLRGIRPNITRQNIEAMLKEITHREIDVVLSAVNAPANLGVSYQRALKNTFEELSDQYNARPYPFLIEKTFGNAALMLRDGIHPNAAGAKLIATDLAEFLHDEFTLN